MESSVEITNWLDMLEVQHSANDILVALNQIIDVSEAIIRAA
jgi:hypothetical protein